MPPLSTAVRTVSTFARRSRRSLALLLAGTLAAVAAPAIAEAPERPGASPVAREEVWVTLGREAFELARRALPARVDGLAPPVAAQSGEVLLTRLPAASFDALSAAIHSERGHCGGFVVHPSLEAGLAEIERLEGGVAAAGWPETPGFAVGQPSWVGSIAGAVTEAGILDTMTALSTSYSNRYHAHATGTATAIWIRDLWLSYATEAGRPEVVVELVPHTGTTQPSVVLTVPGTTVPDEVVILGGHEDSIASGCSIDPDCAAPGADDDASGIATISEVVRVLLASGFQPQRTIRVMAYAAEEVGLVGSGELAQAYLDAGTSVVAVLQLDMTGYYGSTEDVAFISDHTNPDLTAFLGDLLDTYQPELLWTTSACGYACSDHASWHSRGFPAAFAFEARFGEYNPNLHTASDTVANLGSSAAHAAKFARLAAAYLAETSLLAPGTLFADGFERGTTSAWTATVQAP